MADMDFQQLLSEQKKTNELLRQSLKSPTLGESIKSGLGEIINSRSLQTKNQNFQKREGMTNTDNIAEDIRFEQGMTTDNTLMMIDRLDLIHIALKSIKEINLASMMSLKTISGVNKETFDIVKGNDKAASAIEEDEKKRKSDASMFMNIDFIKKLTGDFMREVRDMKKFITPGRGLLKTLFGVGAGLLAADFLTGGDGQKFFKAIDVMITRFKSLYELRIKPLMEAGGEKLQQLIDDMANEDYTYKEIFLNNADTILAGVALLFSRTILATSIAIGTFAFKKGVFGRVISTLLFGSSQLKGGKGSGFGVGKVAKRLGLVGLVLTVLDGLIGILGNELKDETDPTKVKSKYGLLGESLAIITTSVFEGIRDLTLFAVKTLLGDKAGDALEKFLGKGNTDGTDMTNTDDVRSQMQKSFDFFIDSFSPFIALYNLMGDGMRRVAQFLGLDSVLSKEQREADEVRLRDKIVRLREKLSEDVENLKEETQGEKSLRKNYERFLKSGGGLDKKEKMALASQLRNVEAGNKKRIDNIKNLESKLMTAENQLAREFRGYDSAAAIEELKAITFDKKSNTMRFLGMFDDTDEKTFNAMKENELLRLQKLNDAFMERMQMDKYDEDKTNLLINKGGDRYTSTNLNVDTTSITSTVRGALVNMN